MKHYVLQEDVCLAVQLLNCCYDCLKRAEKAIECEQLSMANYWINEFQRARDDLQELRVKKIERDRLITLFHECSRKQIDLEDVVRRISGEYLFSRPSSN
ncbi:hypothetical protein ACJ2A9_09715 [Anaerobacillus sp. MEB173]|uniref:hypothetical protein n=1 Tax=Anaerobacillus sp. MEB173 TaxID=3383345 RepID=UPI003F8F9334